MRDQLRVSGVSDTVVDDAVLILSELLSNACRHGRPLGDAPAGDGDVMAAWRIDTAGRLTVEVTDGGGPTRPVPAKPSVTAHGGRGLNIITALADDWGVRDDPHGEVTVWVVVHKEPAPARRSDGAGRVVGRAPRAENGVHGARSESAARPAVGKQARRTGAAPAAHAHRQAHRLGGELGARLPSRPLSGRADREFAEPFDDPE
ncbi:hypothetical protein GCM10018793_03180 [Streptomyces sulfonofaciens]|uniref:Histidine kinase/HSP90-like ATPase domain-containing protein n=1 Tax=Streptomyces sulfonofaciens TaxID=68272 RepID=A0A919KR07_9ACTN|nr:hypothetical protein GCM10018793_03180 [Streptomyces sulfonofaciens]